MSSEARTAMTTLIVIRRSSGPSGVRLHRLLFFGVFVGLRNHENLGFLNAYLAAVTVSVTVPISGSAIAAGAFPRLGQCRADDPRSSRFEPVEGLDCSASARFTALDHEERRTGGGGE